MPSHENFEIFNVKSCILSITERVLLFENKLIFLTLFLFLSFLMLLVVKSGNFTQRVHNIFSFLYTEIRPTNSPETNSSFFLY